MTYKIIKEYNGKTFTGKETMELSYQQNNVPIVEYKVYIRAFGEDGSYTNGEVLTVPEKANRLGTAKAPTVDNDGVVSWQTVDYAVKYKVVKIVNGVSYGGSVVTDTSYKFNSVPVSDYQVYVAAYGESGDKTVSEKTYAKVANSLGIVNEVSVDSNGKITWKAADNAVEYKVAKVVDGKTYYGSMTADTSYTFKSVPSKDYQVFVVAFSKDGRTSWGKKNLVEVGNLGTVLDPKVDANGNVTWTAARNAVKYKVGKTVNGKTYYTGELTTNSATIKVPKSNYKVFVVAFDKDGNKTWGTKADVKVK